VTDPARPPSSGALRRRLLAAFVLVALTSVVVMTVLALVGASRGVASEQSAAREAAASAAASAAGRAYADAGGWEGADLAAAEEIASAAGARLVVRPSAGGHGGPQGEGVVTADVVVAGSTVGSARLVFGGDSAQAALRVAGTWILVAAAVAVVVAAGVAWFVSRSIALPLQRVAAMARAFAGGDTQVRPSPRDLAAVGEIGDVARAFAETADELVRADDARRRMAADVAHELRTPLAVLQAELEELSDGYAEPSRERLAALHQQSLRLGRVVDDLAQLSAAEAAARSLRRERVELGELARAAVEGARGSFAAAGISAAVEAEPRTVVLADADRLHQVVGNLLANTLRYCRSGDSVTCSVARAGGEAVLIVADTGPGIAEDDLPHIFERLWRGSADVDPAGSGIGLAVVQELVRAHGGTVTARSPGRAGTAIEVRLPLLET
jgi:two-component system sensor histidine kinase BaeS